MLSRNIKKEICIRHFINFESYASISNDLNIHRNTVSNICGSQLKKIKELGLCYSEINLYDYVDKIVPEKNKLIRKVNPATKMLIRSLYLKNEKNHIFKTSEKKNLTALYNEFKNTQSIPNSKNKNYNTDISYSCFYSVIQEIKKDFPQPSCP
ncbi:hypothetical protein AB2T63_04775 [Clostridium butyricum]|uniref:hypothetical protein n=1 Tax=Clostridium butyricum TaxID=1492 RepID=UPI0005EAD730|nr:hypothetical protein [Clostridium butyricum]